MSQVCCEGLAAYRAGAAYALVHSPDCAATDDKPYPDAMPGSLRERLRDAIHVHLTEYGEGIAGWRDRDEPATALATVCERVVVTWLRDKAEQYGDVSLRNLAMWVEDGQA